MKTLLRTLIMGVSCLIVLLLAPIHGQALITSVSILPEQPTSQDTIVFTVEGSFPDRCWYMEGFSFSQQSQNEYAAIVSAVDYAEYLGMCGEIVLEYQYSDTFGPLDPGVYTVFITELHQSIRDSLPDIAVLSFEVAAPSKSADSPSDIPRDYSLAQCYPNPFNLTTTISFDLPMASEVSLTVYNVNGQAVETLVNEQRPAGTFNVSFDGTKLSSGAYFYTLNAGAYSDTKKMLLVK